MERKQLLEDFKETMRAQIQVFDATYVVQEYQVTWSSSHIQQAWMAWVAAYETYGEFPLGGKYE